MYDVLVKEYIADGRLPEAENMLKAKVENNPKQAGYVLNLAESIRFRNGPTT